MRYNREKKTAEKGSGAATGDDDHPLALMSLILISALVMGEIHFRRKKEEAAGIFYGGKLPDSGFWLHKKACAGIILLSEIFRRPDYDKNQF